MSKKNCTGPRVRFASVAEGEMDGGVTANEIW